MDFSNQTIILVFFQCATIFKKSETKMEALDKRNQLFWHDNRRNNAESEILKRPACVFINWIRLKVNAITFSQDTSVNTIFDNQLRVFISV